MLRERLWDGELSGCKAIRCSASGMVAGRRRDDATGMGRCRQQHNKNICSPWAGSDHRIEANWQHSATGGRIASATEQYCHHELEVTLGPRRRAPSNYQWSTDRLCLELGHRGRAWILAPACASTHRVVRQRWQPSPGAPRPRNYEISPEHCCICKRAHSFKTVCVVICQHRRDSEVQVWTGLHAHVSSVRKGHEDV